MGPIVEKVLEGCVLGEGPHWDVSTQNLYFVDILEKKIHRYDPSTKKGYEALIDGNTVSFILPVEGRKNNFIISKGNEIAIVTWDGVSNKVSSYDKLANVPIRDIRFNDGKADPSGRLWAGTMASESSSGEILPNKGALYSLTNGQLKQHFDDVHISNGLTWNMDLKKMYYIDSGKRTVDQFDFDIENGTLSNRKVIFTLGKHNIPGFPDGQTIDSDGNLWVAVFSGSRVIKIDPRKPETLLATVEIPALQVTSVEFGGPNLDELYVTTARMAKPTEKPLDPPIHGALYKILNTGSKGKPSNKVKLL